MSRHLFFIIIFLSGLISKTNAQSAIDFTQNDCNGEMHNLYADLDSGKIVVMEFVMDCQLCVDAGTAIQAMLTGFDQQYPGVFKVYQFAYSTLLDCNSMTDFKDTNNFTSYIFEENGHLMAHYGGFGMPTIAVAAGVSHTDIFSQVGFMISDTSILGGILRNYLSTAGVAELNSDNRIVVFPQPSTTGVNVSCAERIQSLRLINISGNCVKEFTLDDNSVFIDTGDNTPGIYFLEIATGNKIYKKRIVISPAATY